MQGSEVKGSLRAHSGALRSRRLAGFTSQRWARVFGALRVHPHIEAPSKIRRAHRGHNPPHDSVAPLLKREFHREFERRNVNLVNMRKEFFDLGLDEIVAFSKTNGVTVAFTKIAEAKECRKTSAPREKAALVARAIEQPAAIQLSFPSTLPSTLPASPVQKPELVQLTNG